MSPSTSRRHVPINPGDLENRPQAVRDFVELPSTAPQISNCFATALGWAAILGSELGVRRVLVGYADQQSLVNNLKAADPQLEMDDWCPEWRQRLQAYFHGSPDDFRDIPLAFGPLTEFRQQVLTALRAVEYGETVSYAELGGRVGRPGAARAVGRVMATNPMPILVPCHRVLASGRQLGGFSAPRGLEFKQELLVLEGSWPCVQG